MNVEDLTVKQLEAIIEQRQQADKIVAAANKAAKKAAKKAKKKEAKKKTYDPSPPSDATTPTQTLTGAFDAVKTPTKSKLAASAIDTSQDNGDDTATSNTVTNEKGTATATDNSTSEENDDGAARDDEHEARHRLCSSPMCKVL